MPTCHTLSHVPHHAARRTLTALLAAATVAVATLCLTPTRTIAAPLDRATSPADASWLVHVDVESAHTSQLGKAMMQEAKNVGLLAKADAVSSVVGFDVIDNLKNITLYGSGFKREDTVILASIAGNSGNLEGLMLAAPGYQSTRENKRTIHSFIAKDATHGDARMYVIVEPINNGQTTLLIGANDQGNLMNALNRTINRVASTEATPTDSAAGSIVFAEINDVASLPMEGAGEHSATIGMLNRVTMSLTESNQQVKLTADADVVDEQRADQIRQLAQGALAMVQIAAMQKPDDLGATTASDMASRVKIERQGNHVNATMISDVSSLTRTMRMMIEHKKNTHHNNHSASQPSQAESSAPLQP